MLWHAESDRKYGPRRAELLPTPIQSLYPRLLQTNSISHPVQSRVSAKRNLRRSFRGIPDGRHTKNVAGQHCETARSRVTASTGFEVLKVGKRRFGRPTSWL